MNPNMLQALVSKTTAVKVGSIGIFAPAMLLSFIGGMLMWRALQPAADNSQLEAKLAALNTDNVQLKESLQKLVDKLETPKLETIEPAAPAKAQASEKASSSKLAMLKQVLNENIQLRQNV